MSNAGHTSIGLGTGISHTHTKNIEKTLLTTEEKNGVASHMPLNIWCMSRSKSDSYNSQIANSQTALEDICHRITTIEVSNSSKEVLGRDVTF